VTKGGPPAWIYEIANIQFTWRTKLWTIPRCLSMSFVVNTLLIN